jgi:Ca-activated chloride channel homolog
MRFELAWALCLLALLPLLVWWSRRHGEVGVIGFSTTTLAAGAGRSWRQRLSIVPLWLRLLAMALLILCLARPQKGLDYPRQNNQGIAIEMVVDRSGSMAAPMEYAGQTLTRLEVVKRVFSAFVLGNGEEFKGRPSDMVGIVAFGGLADTICPLTLAHDTLPGFLATMQPGGSTAIGDAIALGAARLKTAADELARRTSRDGRKQISIKSKVMILLTDGQNNCGKRDPLQAAQLAAKWGIKIYTIGVGGPASASPTWLAGGLPVFGEQADEASLKAIAQATGAQCRMVQDADGLVAICREIDRFERTELPVKRYRVFKERFPPLAMAALWLLICDSVLNWTVFRRLP